METKPKHDLKFYIDRAVKDFKTLVIYFNVTRPQYEPEFKECGKFSVEKLIEVQRYLKAGWKKADDVKKYNRLSAAYNYTFGIPNELVRKVLGEYVDENGKHHRIPVRPIVKWLQNEGWLGEETDAGKGFVKDKETGKWKTVCQWRKKYPLANLKYWLKLIADNNYGDLNTIPYASTRVKRIIMKWHNEWAGKKQEKNIVEEKKTSVAESRGRRLVKVVEGLVDGINQKEKRVKELSELGKMSDSDVERICYITERHYKEARKNNSQRWERSSAIDSAIRISLPDVSDDLRGLFSQLLPSIWDRGGVK